MLKPKFDKVSIYGIVFFFKLGVANTFSISSGMTFSFKLYSFN